MAMGTISDLVTNSAFVNICFGFCRNKKLEKTGRIKMNKVQRKGDCGGTPRIGKKGDLKPKKGRRKNRKNKQQ
jgi:hypothetical protein